MSTITSIIDLKPFKTSWTIKVKMIRLWKQPAVGGGETIDMVLCDVKGSKIHASVEQKLVEKFGPLLKEGNSNMFINFSILRAIGSYRTTNHTYRSRFVSTTRVLPTEQLPADLCGLEPVKYNEVLDGSLNRDYLVDIVGHVVKVSRIEHVNVHGKETERIHLELRNSHDERIPLVLWGNVACDLNNAIQVRMEYTSICVLRFGKITVWNGERCISNAFNISDVVLDPPMIEVKNFLASLPEDDVPLAIVESKYQAVVDGVSDEDAFFTYTHAKTIAEVLDTKEVDKCLVMCTVAAIDSDMGWFDLTCKVCSNKVVRVPTYVDDVKQQSCFCLKCKIYKPKTVIRYRLHLVVLDSTSNTKFVVFDNHVNQLLNQPLLHLPGPSDYTEVFETDVLPPALNTIVGKTFLFKIGIEEDNIRNRHESYRVMKLITDKDLIYQFKLTGCTNGTKDTKNLNIESGHESATKTDSFDMTPAKRIRAFNGDIGEPNCQNSATSTFSSVRNKKEKLDKSG